MKKAQVRKDEEVEKVTRLGVNIDHVATLRQARGVKYPDPITAAALVEMAGADGIVVHLKACSSIRMANRSRPPSKLGRISWNSTLALL